MESRPSRFVTIPDMLRCTGRRPVPSPLFECVRVLKLSSLLELSRLKFLLRLKERIIFRSLPPRGPD